MTTIRLDIDCMKSSNIMGITFLAEQDNSNFNSHSSISGIAIIEYTNGSVYKYYNVPFGAILKLLSEHSIGSAVKKILGNYGFEKVVSVNDIKKIESQVQDS